MAIFKCTDCGNDVNTDAKACPNCGTSKPFKKQKLTVEQVKMISNKELRQFKKLGGDYSMSKFQKVIFTLIIIIIIVLVSKPDKPLTEGERRVQAQEKLKSDIQWKTSVLRSLCEREISKNLHDSNSANFGEFKIIPLSNETYKIIQEVRAKNGFGAIRKSTFVCMSGKYADYETVIVSIKELEY